MKFKISILFFAFLLCFNCTSNDDSTTQMEEEEEEMMTMEPAFTGMFSNGAHPTSGTVTVNESETTLSFTNFMTDNGPLLEVYLATDASATDFVTLGALQGINGDYDYNIPANVDLTTYKFVIIWCVDFSVAFGTAILE